MKRICILTQSHLCKNPRVVKEAKTLSKAGYNVIILTTFTSEALLKEDLEVIDTSCIQYFGATNIIVSQSNFFRRTYIRFQRRLAGELVYRTGIQLPQALGYNAYGFLKAALQIKADLYISHQEMPTWVGCELIRKGYKVGFDFEDWYSHDLLPQARRQRPIKLLRKIEHFALIKGIFIYTTSDSMAAEMAKAYSVVMPATIYNVFPYSERERLDGIHKDRKDLSKVSMIWFSQTVGPGRGLELLIRALELVAIPIELHIRGNINLQYKTYLLDRFPNSLGHAIYFHDIVSNYELISRLAEHDIGLALEQATPESRNLTVTNKFFQYLQAGLAVIASDTLGQTEIANKAINAIFTYKNDSREDLAKQLTRLISKKYMLKQSKKNALTIVQERYSWEYEEKRLILAISKANL
ncbi:glycosyltransferase [Rhodocytophaga aerolata]|uniref:Glycosyltransferase n=1 Tax=Rhodocytophaga aerolata TaxID=455078 RepID=A0ABT8RCG4_9BACT|nr:glycosyltransferase [Rhodocytophaga aerolata]MDO1449796.1 glycosyltransferase [Rhodocytophaga aerolata]